MSSASDADVDSPFVKKDKCCKICECTDGPMESIFCDADDTAMLNKIYKCTRVEVTPVCGLISPICGPCHRRIEEFDEHAPPKVIEFVIRTDLDQETLDHDPLNIGDMPDPMAIEDDDVEEDLGHRRRSFKRKVQIKAILHAGSTARRRPPGRPPKARPSTTQRRPAVRQRRSIIATDKEEEDDEQEAAKQQDEQMIVLKGRKGSNNSRSASFGSADSPEESDYDPESNGDEAIREEEIGSEISNEEDDSMAEDRLSEGSDSVDSQEEQGDEGRTLHRPRRQQNARKRGGPPEQCEVCGKTVAYMREHMRMHRIEKQHPCPHCDRTFVQANNLKYHIRKHLGEKPFACSKCDKQFYCEAHLKSHMRVHGPQGLFQCTLCPKSFNQECNLRKHLRVHTGEKPYSCNTCGKRFNSTSNLRNHARLHSDDRPLRCEHCGKCFVDVHHLQRHIRVHTGERPYICHVCTSSYFCQNGLMDHLKTHIEKKVYKLD